MSKSHHHKETNTFRFQSFHDRISSIHIDLARKFGKFDLTPQESDTFFGDALVKWTDLNCTEHFVNFHREVSREVNNLAQVVFHQRDLVDSLERHLSVPNSLAVEPLLDLVVQLARDLQRDFLPYFEKFLLTIVKLLSIYNHEPEHLEHLMASLAYLFKFLWRYLIKDMPYVYRLFNPLLGDNYKDYVQSFAAEGFAFLMRKCGDKEAIVNYMINGLSEDPSKAKGVGKLLFETVKLARKQFHHCLEEIVKLLLSRLCDDTVANKLTFTVAEELFRSMSSYTSSEHTTLVWKQLEIAIRNAGNVNSKSDGFRCLLVLLHQWTTYCNGRLLLQTDSLVEMLEMLLNQKIVEHCHSVLVLCVSSLIMNQHCIVTSRVRRSLVSKVFQSCLALELKYEFISQIKSNAFFEQDCLPLFLNYCEEVARIPEYKHHILTLQCVCQLLLSKVTDSFVVEEFDKLAVYQLSFGSAPLSSHFVHWILELSELVTTSAVIANNISTLWSVLYLIPHFKIGEKEKLKVLLSKHMKALLEQANEITDHEKIGDILMTCRQCFISSIRFDYTLQSQLISSSEMICLLKRHSSNVWLLSLCDLWLSISKADKAFLSLELFKTLFDILHNNLQSPFSQMRILTLRLFNHFKNVLPPLRPLDNPDIIVDQSLFEICLLAENTTSSVQTYRQKLVYLQKLHADHVTRYLPQDGSLDLVPLKYLLGVLYANFSLLWKPVMELISSHARSLPTDNFWTVFNEVLQVAASESEKALLEESADSKKTMLEESVDSKEIESEASAILTTVTDEYKATMMSDHFMPPDHRFYRDHLWQAMEKFAEVCERRSRYLSPLLFRFLENEYYPADLTYAPTQNLLRHDKDGEIKVTDTEMEKDNEDNDDPEADKSNGKEKRRRASNKNLIIHLRLFARFTNPRSVYMEAKLNTLYHELLQHRDVGVQSVALQCLLTYKFPYLVPYKENFEHILDDKQFKNELVTFSISEDSGVIKAEHRMQLMPILMSILYGKMQTKTGKATGGRGFGHLRKNIVLRFLAGCLQEELAIFLDMIFKPFAHFMNGNISELVKHLLNASDFSAIIPLRKQLGALSTIEFVINKLGHRIPSYHQRLLQLVVCLAAGSLAISEHKNLVNSWVLSSVKTLRNMAQTRLCEFFSTFVNYSFNREEIDAIFDVIVWPKTSRLSLEGVHSPTPLLRLFLIWSQNRRYHELLIKTDSSKQLTVLPAVFNLLNANCVQESVASIIVELIHNLLNFEEVVEEDDVMCDDKAIDVGYKIEIDKSIAPPAIAMLLPHLSPILLYLRKKISSINNMPKKKKKAALLEKEFKILARLSEFVTSSTECEEIAGLLIQLLNNKFITSADCELDVLHTLAHLMHHTLWPHEFLISLAPLFSSMPSRIARSALCEVLQAIGKKCETVRPVTDAVCKINSWDRRHVDAPDYMKRIEGFSQADALMAAAGLTDGYMFIVFVHNSCFMLANVDDMAIRDVSSTSLHKTVDQLSTLQSTLSTDNSVSKILVEHLQPLVLQNICHKAETVRHEFISVLAHLVRSFASPRYPQFNDLLPLTDSDHEVDFFINITHIQLHRRARALLRLSKHLSTNRMQSSVLSTYLLPLIFHFINDDAFVKHTNITDAGIEALNAICRQLSWQHYHHVLRAQLKQVTKSLDRQKLAVRLMVTVLDSFHFDMRHFSMSSHKEIEVKPIISNDVDNLKNNNMMELDGETELVVGGSDSISGKEDAKTSDEATQETFTVICSPSLARRIYSLITVNILPQLHRLLTMKAQSDDEHKQAHAGKFVEDLEILRVPLAIAMVKLLQVLPAGPLDTNLPGILLKVCHFLKSRSIDIRTAAKETLVKIAQSLGSRYLPYIVKEMKTTLTRGYQVHILCHVTWTLLNSLSDILTSGDLDTSIKLLTEVFNQELFGSTADEKEIAGIVRNVPEAKSSKSAESYGTLAKYVSANTLPDLIAPIKEVLEGTHSLKTARKAAEVLIKIAQGLVANTGLSVCALLTFIYQMASSAGDAMLEDRKEKEIKEETAADRRTPSTLLLKKSVQRGSARPKAHKSTNIYILLEFALQVLHQMLKQSSLSSQNLEHLRLLDPFIAIIEKCLSSKHVKVVGSSIRCLAWLMKFPLPYLKKCCHSITNSLFVLLHTYAGRTSTHGDNVQLVTLCFKVITILIREIRYQPISKDQLHVLLNYIEQDITGHTRQTAAFNLLKSILTRRLVSPQINEVINHVEKLSVMSEVSHVRLQCRQVVLQYMMDYPLGRKLQAHLEFFISQLEYEYESGRESVLEMLATIFSTFPQNLLVQYSGLFFVPLASRLSSDESQRCRRLTSLAIKSLLDKLPVEERDKLLSMCFTWFSNSKSSVCQLACILCGLFVEVEGASFDRHLNKLLHVLEELIRPELIPDCSASEPGSDDLLLFHKLTLLLKLIEHCQPLHNSLYSDIFYLIWDSVKNHLTYPHSWVRLVTSQLFGQLFASYDPQDLANSIAVRGESIISKQKARHLNNNSSKSVKEFLLTESAQKIKLLCEKFCDQLSVPEIDSVLADQITKNLIFLGKVIHYYGKLKRTPETNGNTERELEEDFGKESQFPTMNWLVWRLCKETRTEVALTPKIFIRRNSTFKWIAAMAMFLEVDEIAPYLPRLMKPLVREITDASKTSDNELRQLAQEVLELLKSTIGTDLFSQQYAMVHQILAERRGTRKLNKAQQAVIRPQVAAKRRIKKHIAQKEAKKRKLDELRPSRKMKQKRLNETHSDVY